MAMWALQWGHRLSAVETDVLAWPLMAPVRFNGATAFRQWKPHHQEICQAEASRFNWGHRLGSGIDGRRVRHVGNASMGPPPFGSGNKAHQAVAWTAANGATAFRQHHYSVGQRERSASMGPPPFGSGNTIGQQVGRTRTFRTVDASMGPPPFGSGNRYLCPDSDFSPWDRAASAANTSVTRRRFISA